MHDIDVIKRELPVDLLEFFFLTPLPGSEDHQKLHRAGVAMDPDLNKYDLNHVTTAHPLMSKAEFEKVYADAWSRYYSLDHVETMMRRAAVRRFRRSQVLLLSTWFMGALKIEGVHPLEVGWIRLKSRLNRRHGMKIEPAVLFYPKYYAELGWKLARWAGSISASACGSSRCERDPEPAQLHRPCHDAGHRPRGTGFRAVPDRRCADLAQPGKADRKGAARYQRAGGPVVKGSAHMRDRARAEYADAAPNAALELRWSHF